MAIPIDAWTPVLGVPPDSAEIARRAAGSGRRVVHTLALPEQADSVMATPIGVVPTETTAPADSTVSAPADSTGVPPRDGAPADSTGVPPRDGAPADSTGMPPLDGAPADSTSAPADTVAAPREE
jgi:hypothetical protein